MSKFEVMILFVAIIGFLFCAFQIHKTYCKKAKKQADMKTDVADEPQLEPPIVTPKPKEVPLPNNPQGLNGERLWQWWTSRTGDWNVSRDVIDMFANMLSSEQREELIGLYMEEHTQLCQGIKNDKNWEQRADVYAKVLGQRIASLMNKK